MTKLEQKTLKFTKLFRGFNLKVEINCEPTTNDPRNQYDYKVNHTQVLTTSECVDLTLLVAAWEKILFDIQVYVQDNIHSLYIHELTSQRKQTNYNYQTTF